MDLTMLEPRDRFLADYIEGALAAAAPRVEEARQTQCQIQELGVRVSLAEVLLARGVLDTESFRAAAQAAAAKGMGLVDRSSMRHLQVTREEDRRVVERAQAAGFLDAAQLADGVRVQASIEAFGVSPLLSKVLADRKSIDIEIYEGILFVAARPGKAPAGGRPFEEEDLLFAQVALERGQTQRVQAERGLKIRARLRKVGIEKCLPEILFELGAIDELMVQVLATVAGNRLDPPRSLRYHLVRWRDDQKAALDRMAEGGSLAPADAVSRAREIQKSLAAGGLTRSLGQIVFDLGAANGDLVRQVMETRLPAAQEPPAPPRPPALPPTQTYSPAPPGGSPRPPAPPSPPSAKPPALPMASATAPAKGPGRASSPAAPARLRDSSPRRGRTGMRGSSGARHDRPGRPSRGGVPGTVIAMGALLAVGGGVVAIVLTSGSSAEPIQTGEEDPSRKEPRPPERPAPLSDSEFAKSLESIRSALEAGAYGEAHSQAEALGGRVVDQPTRKVQLTGLGERARNLVEFRAAIKKAVDLSKPVSCPTGAWATRAVHGVTTEGLEVQVQGKGARLLAWANVPPSQLQVLIDHLGVDDSAPIPTLHYFLQMKFDEGIRSHAAKAIQARSDLRLAILALVGEYLGVADPAVELVVEDGRVLTRAEKAAAAGETPPREGMVKHEGRWITVEEKERIDNEAAGRILHEGKWITAEEKERIDNERKGLVEHEGKWIPVAEKERLDNEAAGKILYEGRWIYPEDKERIDNEKKGLVEYEGEWLPREEAERRRNLAEGKVLHKGEWVTAEEKKRLEEEEANVKLGKVYFRGQWIEASKRAILEDMVEEPTPPEHVRSLASYRCEVSTPSSDKWVFTQGQGAPVGQGSPIFTLTKREEGKTLVTLYCTGFQFGSNYNVPGARSIEEVGGDNPSGLLRVHRDIYEAKKGGAIVRVKMQKDFFHKDMHAFWCHLEYRDGSVVKIYSLTSNLEVATFSYVFVAEFEPGQFAISGLGVDSVLKTFHLTDRD